MSEHTKRIPAGRSVWCGGCGEIHLIEDGEPDITSVEGLDQVKVLPLDQVPCIDDGENIDLSKLEAAITAHAETYYICPANPDYCGSTDGTEFSFDEVWQCTNCESSHDTEADAERCCAYYWEREKRMANAYIRPAELNVMPSIDPVQVLKGMSTEQIQEAIRAATGADVVEITLRTGAVVPPNPADWGLR